MNSLVSDTAFVSRVVWSFCNQGDWELGGMANPAYRGLSVISVIAQSCARFNEEVGDGAALCRETILHQVRSAGVC